MKNLPPELLARIETLGFVLRWSEFNGWVLTVGEVEFIFDKGQRAIRQIQFCITMIEAVIQQRSSIK